MNLLLCQENQWDNEINKTELRVLSLSILLVLYSLGSLCVSFYYHMHGKSVGTLSLILKSTDGTQSTRYFSMSGEQSTNWIHTRVDVLVPGVKCQLIFEATVGQKHLSDIAVDDVRVGIMIHMSCWEYL